MENDFFRRWSRAEETGTYITHFLSEYEITQRSFTEGCKEEMASAYQALSECAMEPIIAAIQPDWRSIRYSTVEIPNFSNVEVAFAKVPEVLCFYQEGLSREELGARLTDADNALAKTKYAEQQSRVSEWLGLVERVPGRRKVTLRNTAWGTYMTRYPLDQKMPAYSKLLLRNRYIQRFISACVNETHIRYADTLAGITKASIERRRQSVHHVADLILQGTEYEGCLDNIDWKV